MADRNEYKRQWVEKNRDKVNEYLKSWQKKNPDKVKQYRETYFSKEENIEKLNEHRRKWYADNIEYQREKNRIRQARFRERQKALKEQNNG